MRAGVHQKSYMSLEVEVAGTALVGGTIWASIRPAIKCIMPRRVRVTAGGAVLREHVYKGVDSARATLNLVHAHAFPSKLA